MCLKWTIVAAPSRYFPGETRNFPAFKLGDSTALNVPVNAPASPPFFGHVEDGLLTLRLPFKGRPTQVGMCIRALGAPVSVCEMAALCAFLEWVGAQCCTASCGGGRTEPWRRTPVARRTHQQALANPVPDTLKEPQVKCGALSAKLRRIWTSPSVIGRRPET